MGFFAKLFVLQAALEAGYTWLVVFAVLISVVGAFYYLRVVWYMYFEAAGDLPRPDARARMRLILALNAAGVVALGLIPNALLSICTHVIP